MFEKKAEEYIKEHTFFDEEFGITSLDVTSKTAFKDGAETTLRKVIKYFSTIVLDENCGGYFSRLLESEEKLQELAKELENV